MHQRARCASGAQEVDDQVHHLRVKDRGHGKMFPGGRGTGKNENTGTDDRANAKRG